MTELKRLNATVRLAFGDQIVKGLEETASTADRRRIWAAIDGQKLSKEISKELAIPRRTVDNFLSIATSEGLLINPYGKPPRRLVDVVPPGWELAKARVKEESTASPQGM